MLSTPLDAPQGSIHLALAFQGFPIPSGISHFPLERRNIPQPLAVIPSSLTLTELGDARSGYIGGCGGLFGPFHT